MWEREETAKFTCSLDARVQFRWWQATRRPLLLDVNRVNRFRFSSCVATFHWKAHKWFMRNDTIIDWENSPVTAWMKYKLVLDRREVPKYRDGRTLSTNKQSCAVLCFEFFRYHSRWFRRGRDVYLTIRINHSLCSMLEESCLLTCQFLMENVNSAPSPVSRMLHVLVIGAFHIKVCTLFRIRYRISRHCSLRAAYICCAITYSYGSGPRS